MNNWYRTLLLEQTLPRWQASAATGTGLFLPHLDRRWRQTGKTFGTVVSQCRLLYNFACGYRLTGVQAYLDAVESGTNFLLKRFRDNEHGGWYWACSLDGAVIDNKKDCYGQAFALFGLCHAWSVLHDDRLKQEALHTWETIRTWFREPNGGFIYHFDRAFTKAAAERSQNPVMHLFEALLAAVDTGLEPGLLSEAQQVGRFILDLRDSTNRLPEVFDSNWKLLPESRGGHCNIGHAFEWAFLLSKGSILGLPASFIDRGREFLDYGTSIGLDREKGGIFSSASYDGTIQRKKGWWEQCEAIRALQHYVSRRGADNLQPALESCIEYVQDAFIDLEYGGWYSEPSPRPGSPGEYKGSEWKMDYHVVGMCIEAL